MSEIRESDELPSEPGMTASVLPEQPAPGNSKYDEASENASTGEAASAREEGAQAADNEASAGPSSETGQRETTPAAKETDQTGEVAQTTAGEPNDRSQRETEPPTDTAYISEAHDAQQDKRAVGGAGCSWRR